jgi:hypothetical protein
MKIRDPCYFSFVSAEVFLCCGAVRAPPLHHLLPFLVVVNDSVRISDRVAPIVGRWVVSYNLEGMCQEAVMAWSRYFPGICLEGLRKTTKTSVLRPRVESIVFRLQVEGVPATPDRSVLYVPSHCPYYHISAVTVSVIVSCSATNMLEIVLYWPVFLWVTC